MTRAITDNSVISWKLYAAALFLAVALLSCDTSQEEQPLSQEQNTALLNKLATSIGISFPAGTKLIRYDSDFGSDGLIRAKLVFTPAQWTRFVDESPLDPETFEEEQRYLLGTNVEWWNPEDPAELPTAQASLPDAKVLNVGIDRSDPNLITAFLVWHGT
ncbi:MAG: hypothetical protein V2J55_18575 [Candidatus Competibacteraceae bacterium]|jgi:hypothetical protein|nr:hypothetical protein [Candidatus Competibacteraceae bacterium]